MANEKVPLPPHILKNLQSYHFKFFRKDGNHLENIRQVQKETDFKELVNEISETVFFFIQRKQDENIFDLIINKAKKDGRVLSMQEYIDQKNPINLINEKTLKACIRDRMASVPVINILKAFTKVVNIEEADRQHLKRVMGTYNLYNLHNTIRGKYQVSNLYLDAYNTSKLVYFSRRNEMEENPVQAEIIGNDKLLLSFRRDNCLLQLYTYIGAGSHPNLLQPVYMYNNSKGHTIASLAILQKVTEDQLEKPARELNEIDNLQIARFLQHRAQMLTACSPYGNDMRFDIEDLKVSPGPYHQAANFYEQAKVYTGLFHIFFCEHFPSHKDYIRNDFYSSVGKGILWIYEGADGVLRCRMKTRRNRKGRVLMHEGWISNETLNNSDYLIISLFLEKDHDKYLNLLLFKVSEDLLFGSHNIMYALPGKLGAGSVILNRIEPEENNGEAPSNETYFQQAEPHVLYPELIEQESKREEFIFNYLTRKGASLVSPLTDFEKLSSYKDMVHEGWYKMYSYGKGGLRIGILRIHRSGFAEHISVGGQQNTRIKAYGKTELLRQILSITLKNEDNRRTGFCVFKTESDVPPIKGKTVYLGTFCGVTRRNGEFPLASRLILEFMGKEVEEGTLQPQWLKFSDPGYREVNEAFREALKGRSKSMIGFFKNKSTVLTLDGLKKFNKNELDKGEAFLKAAAYTATYEKSATLQSILVEKAKKYGHLQAEESFAIMMKQQATVCMQRAAYYLALKDDLIKCLEQLKKAQQISPHSLPFDQFEQDVRDCKMYKQLIGETSYKELKAQKPDQ